MFLLNNLHASSVRILLLCNLKVLLQIAIFVTTSADMANCTRSYLTFVFALAFLCGESESEITVVHKLTKELTATLPHSFTQLDFEGLAKRVTFLTVGIPLDGCSEEQKGPPLRRSKSSLTNEQVSDAESTGWILLVDNSGCSLDRKIKSAQTAGYSALIVYNAEHNSTQPMPLIDTSQDEGTTSKLNPKPTIWSKSWDSLINHLDKVHHGLMNTLSGFWSTQIEFVIIVSRKLQQSKIDDFIDEDDDLRRNEQEERQRREREQEERRRREYELAKSAKFQKFRSILNLAPHGPLTRVQINKAFKNISPAYHPDRASGESPSLQARNAETFKEMSEAKTELLNQLEREE